MTSPAILPTPPPSAVWLLPTGQLSTTSYLLTTPSLIRLTAVRPPLHSLLYPAASSTPQLLQRSLAIFSSLATPPPPMPLRPTSLPPPPRPLISTPPLPHQPISSPNSLL